MGNIQQKNRNILLDKSHNRLVNCNHIKRYITPHLLAKRSGNNKKSILISLYKFAYIV